MLVEVAVDGGLKIDDGCEGAAPDAPAGQDREEVFHRVEPGPGGRGEVEHPARMAGQPLADFRVLVSGIVVEDGVDDLADADLALDGIEEAG